MNDFYCKQNLHGIGHNLSGKKISLSGEEYFFVKEMLFASVLTFSGLGMH